MDLHSIEAVLTPASLGDVPCWTRGQAWLAGGTWLFSEPQPTLRTLVDLVSLHWPATQRTEAGLRVGATCTIAELAAYSFGGPIQAAVHACCEALLGSFKIWNAATVGGNVCLALPAAPMLALTVALDGVACVSRDGSERAIPMASFALGPQRTVLEPGDLLHFIDLPEAALQRRTAVRRISLTTHGRSAALLLATLDPAGGFVLTVTASTPRPVRFAWPELPAPGVLDATLAALPPEWWFDDVHGAPAWRRHVTRRLAAELLAELAA